jgi:hypothetical protein
LELINLEVPIPKKLCPQTPELNAELFAEGDVHHLPLQKLENGHLAAVLHNKGRVGGKFETRMKCRDGFDKSIFCYLLPDGTCPVTFEIDLNAPLLCQFRVVIFAHPCAGAAQSYAQTIFVPVRTYSLPLVFAIPLYVILGLCVVLICLLIVFYLISISLKSLIKADLKRNHIQIHKLYKSKLQRDIPEKDLFEIDE